MTQVEAAELAATWTGIATTDTTVFLTITFAYLVAAFFVGSQLTRFQAFTLSIMFFISAGNFLLAVLEDLSWMAFYQAKMGNLAPAGLVVNGQYWLISTGAICSAGILVSLYFMWNVRHANGK